MSVKSSSSAICKNESKILSLTTMPQYLSCTVDLLSLNDLENIENPIIIEHTTVMTIIIANACQSMFFVFHNIHIIYYHILNPTTCLYTLVSVPKKVHEIFVYLS